MRAISVHLSLVHCVLDSAAILSPEPGPFLCIPQPAIVLKALTPVIQHTHTSASLYPKGSDPSSTTHASVPQPAFVLKALTPSAPYPHGLLKVLYNGKWTVLTSTRQQRHSSTIQQLGCEKSRVRSMLRQDRHITPIKSHQSDIVILVLLRYEPRFITSWSRGQRSA